MLSGDVAPVAVSIAFATDTATAHRLPPDLPEVRVLVFATAATALSGAAAALGASDLDPALFCVTRTFELLRAIGSTPDIESARSAALQATVGAQVVVVVLDDELVQLAEQSIELGVETLGDIGMPVLMLTGVGAERDEDYARAGAWLRRHVRGVISADATAHEILAAIRAVNAGLVVLEPRMSLALQKASVRKRSTARAGAGDTLRAAGQSPPLSAREREVLALLAEGLATKNIAHQLGISSHTVKAHVESIFAKFGATTRAEAVAIGVRRGEVRCSSSRQCCSSSAVAVLL